MGGGSDECDLGTWRAKETKRILVAPHQTDKDGSGVIPTIALIAKAFPHFPASFFHVGIWSMSLQGSRTTMTVIVNCETIEDRLMAQIAVAISNWGLFLGVAWACGLC